MYKNLENTPYFQTVEKRAIASLVFQTNQEKINGKKKISLQYI